MRRVLCMLVFAALLVMREAGAQSTEEPEPAASVGLVPSCYAVLTPYGWTPVCSTMPVDPAEFERQVSEYFTNGASVLAMPSEGPAAPYFHDAARVLAAPTTPWGVPVPPQVRVPSRSPAPVPTVVSTATASGTAPAAASTEMAPVPLPRPAPVASATESPVAPATKTPPAPVQPVRQQAPSETPPLYAQPPAAAPSGTASPVPGDLGEGIPSLSRALSPREPVIAPEPSAPEPSAKSVPAPKPTRDPLWAVIVVGGFIIGGLLYVIGALLRRTRPPLGPRGV